MVRAGNLALSSVIGQMSFTSNFFYPKKVVGSNPTRFTKKLQGQNQFTSRPKRHLTVTQTQVGGLSCRFFYKKRKIKDEKRKKK